MTNCNLFSASVLIDLVRARILFPVRLQWHCHTVPIHSSSVPFYSCFCQGCSSHCSSHRWVLFFLFPGLLTVMSSCVYLLHPSHGTIGVQETDLDTSGIFNWMSVFNLADELKGWLILKPKNRQEFVFWMCLLRLSDDPLKRCFTLNNSDPYFTYVSGPLLCCRWKHALVFVSSVNCCLLQPLVRNGKCMSETTSVGIKKK